MSPDHDPSDRSLAMLAAAVHGVAAGGRDCVFVGLDGRSGAGKSTLAQAFVGRQRGWAVSAASA